MTSPAGAVLLVAHILAVVVAYGALGTTGVYAHRARIAADPFSSEPLKRFFRSGNNLAARVLFVVPFLGFALLAVQPSGDFTRAYPWVGLFLWTISVAVATGGVWPAERELQDLICAGPGPGARTAVRDAARRAERGATVLAACFVVAVAVMIARV